MGERFILRARVVHTLDPQRPRAQALLIEDGRIAAIGDDADVAAWRRPGMRVLDCRDGAALPGLQDAHLHLLGYALDRTRVDLRGTRSPAEGAARVAAHAARLGRDEWVVGRGWDRNRFESPRWPTAEDLGDASGGRPVALMSVDGHAAWANAAALAAAGLGGAGDPPGGIVRRAADGRPEGVVLESAVDLLRAAIPDPAPRRLAEACRAACEALAALGLTEVWTMDGRADLVPALDADGDRPLALRVVVHAAAGELEAAARLGVRPGLGSGRVRLGGVKFFADGALGTQTAHMLEPYAGAPHNRGVIVTPAPALAAAVLAAAHSGLPPVVHAIGDAAVRAALDAFAAIPPAVRAALPFAPRVEHAQCIHPDDVPRFARLGVEASVQPRQIPLDVPIAERHWGARAAHAYPFRSLARAGARLRMGSDAPVVPPDLGGTWRAAVARLPAAGEGDRPWTPAEALSLGETLLASVAGPLVPGARADVTVVAPDPFTLPPAALDTVRALCTLVDGRVTHAAAA